MTPDEFRRLGITEPEPDIHEAPTRVGGPIGIGAMTSADITRLPTAPPDEITVHEVTDLAGILDRELSGRSRPWALDTMTVIRMVLEMGPGAVKRLLAQLNASDIRGAAL